LGTKNPAMNRLPGLLALAALSCESPDEPKARQERRTRPAPRAALIALTVPGTGWDAAASGLKGPPLGATTRRPRMNRR
jgi:hypothetical protein